jgi:hypothetical protein
MLVEYACKDLVFHFNKKHLEDPTIPMWVIKTHGETFYINHVESTMPWSTKETPENDRTKGSIKFKECLLTIDDSNCAKLAVLTIFDKIRLRNQKLGITRIRFSSQAFEKHLETANIKHTPFKQMRGTCGSGFSICDLTDKKQLLLLQIQFPKDFRILMPNEDHYKAYDDVSLWSKLQKSFIDDDYGEYNEEDDEDDEDSGT